jgi:uracil-DNA glycosylase
MPDARKPLQVLAQEWSGCTSCELGVRRLDTGGSFVFGEGVLGGMMLIGEGPGSHEEKEGRPFIGKSGKLLRRILEMLGVNDYYITNTVACRSCAEAFDSIGRPIMNSRTNTPRIQDEPPTPVQVTACKPRLHEQVYIVDPLLIIACGGGAASALTGKAVSITRDHGVFQEIELPGRWRLPVLTEKKKVWVRKVHGEIIAPTSVNMVRYLMMQVVHPAYALRFVKDRRQKNIFVDFVRDMQKGVKTYNRIVEEYGAPPVTQSDLSIEEIEDYAHNL